MSRCDEADLEEHNLIKELTIEWVKHIRSEINVDEFRHFVEGAEVARLRRRFTFVLQQAASF